jgi:Fe-S-cluster containining protein
MEFREALETLLPFLDDVYDRWGLDAKQLEQMHSLLHPEEKTTCTKGCGACCHFPLVPVTAGEAFAVFARILASGEKLETLAESLFAYAKTYFEFSKREGGLPFTDAQQRAFLKAQLPCPFFVSTPEKGQFSGHCGIFPIRPLICDYFNSTESPELCARKSPHRAFKARIDRGEAAVEEVRQWERAMFGRSALGHLPLFIASFCTEAGMAAFQKEYTLSDEQEALGADGQHEADFEFFVELLEACGYGMQAHDIHNLIAAQEELSQAKNIQNPVS